MGKPLPVVRQKDDERKAQIELNEQRRARRARLIEQGSLTGAALTESMSSGTLPLTRTRRK